MNRDEYLQIIQENINQNLLEEAELCIEQYIHSYGYDDEIASMDAIINIYNNELIKAIECVQQGLNYNLFNGDLYVTLGNIYELEEDYNRAYLCYEHSLEVEMSEENYLLAVNLMNNLKEKSKVTLNKYSIVMLTYNNLDYTKVCIESIRKYNKLNNYEIIIIDNNSTDGTVEWLKEQKEIKVILNNENKGFPAGCNQGIEISEKENDIFLLNNDTVIMPNSIFNLRMGLYSDDKIGATGAVSNSISYYQQVNVQYDNFDDYMNFAIKNNVTNANNYEQRIKLVGFAMLIKRGALNKTGLLDERFTPGNFEDDDLSLRIVMEGYKLLLCKDSYIHHFGSVSFKENSVKYNGLLKENSNKFKDKWGFVSENSTGIRYDLINFINDDKEKKINVLEIGCACGATLVAIKNKYPNSNVYGIEIHEHSAKIAKNFADIRSENIEDGKLSYDEKFFDYIILGDVLEHLYNSVNVLENLKKYLKEEGSIIASIPNVMHYSIIYNLLQGNWTYEDCGILDKNHIRFFTKNEVIKMFERSGYSQFKIEMLAVPPIDDNMLEFIKSLTQLSQHNDSNQFVAYQYLIKATNAIKFDEKLMYEIGSLLRRIEFNIDIEETEKELIEILQNGNLNEKLLLATIDRYVINKILILNYLAMICFERKVNIDILKLLNKAYELDPYNLDTSYNLAYVLKMIGENNSAMDILCNLNETNDEIEQLKNSIGGKYYE